MFRNLNFLKQWFWVFPVAFIIVQQCLTFNMHADKFADVKGYTDIHWGNDFITVYQKRFLEVKSFFLKPAHMGYCSEPGQTKPTFYLHYVLTQYNLAPNIVVEDTNTDTILYNLYETIHIDPANNFHLRNGWHVIRDFNNGFILLAK